MIIRFLKVATLVTLYFISIESAYSQNIPAGCTNYHQPCQSVGANICQSTDDIIEAVNWAIVTNLQWLEVGGAGDRQTGLRFKTVDLPSNAIIKEACIQFYGGWSSEANGTVNVLIEGEDLTQNSVTFNTNVGTITNRPRTSANTVWPIPEFRFGANTNIVKSADLTSIINEFLAEGWTQGNPMTFLFSSTSAQSKIFMAYDTEVNSTVYPDGTLSPRLNIVYSLPEPTCSNVGGVVYNDVNDNGTFNDNDPSICEEGLADIVVNLYNDSGLVGTTTTDNFGNWTYPIANGDSVRVEYVYPSYFDPAKSSSLLSSTETAFVFAPECCLDFGLHEKKGYACSNPEVVAICNARCVSTMSPMAPAILSIAESDKSNSTTSITDYQSTVNPISVTIGRVGSLYGLAYNKKEDVLYAGAYYYNSGTIGPLGTGGIYCVDNSSNDGTHLSVNDGMVTDMVVIPNTGADPTGGVCIEDDPSLMQYSAKIGLGDVDINCTYDTLYTINLYTMELVAIPIDGCSTGTPVNYSLPTPQGTHVCTGDEIRPHALKYHQGKVYIGAICTANNSQDINNLWAYVFEYSEGSGINPVPVLDFPLDYNRANANFRDIYDNQAYGNWLPWRDNFSTPVFPDTLVKHDLTQFMYPQPVFADIEFSKCDMSISLQDRFTSQFFRADEPSGQYNDISSVPAGEILKAGFNGNGTWTLENDALTVGQKTGEVQTAGAGTQQGPGGGEFYHQESYSGHTELVIGGLTQIPGNPAIIAATYDPSTILLDATGITRWGSGGLNWYNNTTGEVDYGWEGYYGVSSSFSKGNGFGDVEHICDCPPIEVGNRVWCDIDGDGIQDPEEPPVPSVVLNIYDALGNLAGTTSTDADGRYYFNNTNVSGDVGPFSKYFIALDPANFDTNGDLNIGGTYYGILTDTDFSSMGQSDNNDSDAVLPDNTASGLGAIDGSNVPYICLTTGDYGCNDFSFDFGFYKCPGDACFSITVTRN